MLQLPTKYKKVYTITAFTNSEKRLPPFASDNIERLVDQSYSYFLLVPEIRDKKDNEKKIVDIIAGKDARLTCQVKNSGTTTSWLKNNKTISPSDHPRMRIKLNKYLKIKRVEKDDAGFYTCVAENDCGRNTFTVELLVGSKLTFDTEETSIRLAIYHDHLVNTLPSRQS